MLAFVVIVLTVTSLACGQNLIPQLPQATPPAPGPPSPGVPMPASSSAPSGPVFDPNCKNRIDSCDVFPDTSCQDPYQDWAKLNCRQRCGFCVGPSTPPPACVDTLKNCKDYPKTICNQTEYTPWVNENCRAYCGHCTQYQLAHTTTTTTTIAPVECYDRVDCRTFGANACSKAFEGWSRDNCPLYCGLCAGTPTTPLPCEDRIPNCKAYEKAICSNKDYTIWVQDNCRSYCSKC